MKALRLLRKAAEHALLGDTLLPQEFTLGMLERQDEVRLWLHVEEKKLDVTRCSTTACAAPLTLCIAIQGQAMQFKKSNTVTLVYHQNDSRQTLLGSLQLRWLHSIEADGQAFELFEVASSSNLCLPRRRLLAHQVLRAYQLRRGAKGFDVQMSFRDYVASVVTFIRPHPLGLVSLCGPLGGNLFPMNLMGDLGDGYFGFGLKNSRRAAHLVEAAGRFVLCSVPLEQCGFALRLAVNHKRDCIAWNELPCVLERSLKFSIPYPAFAPRIREMEVATIHRLGSHTFFIARTVSDIERSDTLRVHMVHGHYQWWRTRGDRHERLNSLREDALRKKS